ncbi:hypothetical protein LP090_08515 [Moraxella bovis]|uniref:Uncharacterized protein n=2 Tax=Moraxella TaxID=475 RepID=A0A378QQW3_9GAMM|nr:MULTISPECIES: hypothetical protein [Moraxella]OPH37351.1 hypothetical protein B5J93_08275 [Moraxella equi]UYZ69333.1 hypothetical protein LP122_04460 [Moraxella bovis]UYZ71705.1 hypothetical protein LP089_04510 [Moraxella bovis]UYZ72379.1 hypothetical protein LP105_08150 [Moraxella bovis]UZA15002.1 hypothetical protein LP102_04455 [Moraxella bovis]
MCCQIDLNSKSDVVHFLGKTEPNLLPKTSDNVAGNIVYTGEPAMSLWDKIMARWQANKMSK